METHVSNQLHVEMTQYKYEQQNEHDQYKDQNLEHNHLNYMLVMFAFLIEILKVEVLVGKHYSLDCGLEFDEH
jgi:hypothetical protein